MSAKTFSICFVLIFVPFFLNFPHVTSALLSGGEGQVPVSDGPAVRKDERTNLVSTEFGEISAVKISDRRNGFYYLHFITMNPRSLFLPSYLHSEMLFYVDSGNGTLSWMNAEKDDKLQQVPLQRGVIYRLEPQTVFYIQNNAESTGSAYGYGYGYETQILRIYAIFPGSETELQTKQQFSEPYTGVHDLVLGFDNNVLEATFGVPQVVIEELRGGERQPLIVEGQPAADTSMWGVGPLGPWANRAFLGITNNDLFHIQNKNKAYDIYKDDRDIETFFGWSTTVTRKELDALKHTDFGVFMVYLTKGSMMGPHCNPRTDEVAIVLNGQGMVEVVCPGVASETGCQNSRFRVEEGDVFVVPKSHPMAQISFNNDYFVFLGFRKTLKDDRPQTLTGKSSILQRLDRTVLEKSFNVKNTTLDWILADKKETYIYECISCAEAAAAAEESESEERGGGQGRQQEEEESGGQGRPQEEEESGGQGGQQGEGERGGQGGPQGGGRRGGSQAGGPEESEEGQGGGPGRWQEEQGGGSPGESQEGQGRGGPGGWQWGPGGVRRPELKVA